jgi:hypothetical protein
MCSRDSLRRVRAYGGGMSEFTDGQAEHEPEGMGTMDTISFKRI